MGNVQRTLRTVSVQCDLPDTPDADLDAEPEVLMCPITRTMFRDPVMVVESGHTYERSAILSHFEHNGAKDPLTNRALSSTKVMKNWAVRKIVQAWLDKHPGVTPDDGTRTFDDEGDVGVLRTWRAISPELQERWPEAARPEEWRGVKMENGRVVELELQGLGLTGAVLTEIGQLTSLKRLWLGGNQLTSVPKGIGLLTDLKGLWLGCNRLTSVPAWIGQLTSLRWLDLGFNQLTSVPKEIWQLTSLWKLNLNRNRLTSMPARIGQLTSLRWLDLGFNRLTSVPAEIGQLTSLRELNLSYSQLTSLPAEIGQLTALERLDLRANELTSLPAEIGKLRSLAKLVLRGTQLDDDVTWEIP